MLRWLRVFLALAIPCAPAQTSRRLVKLNVAVLDAKQEPVTDLRSTELFVREDGKPQHIALFRFAGSNRKGAAPAAGEFANRASPAPTVILLDRWNERMATAAAGWIDVRQTLAGLETTQGIYVYFLTPHGDLFPVHPLPTSNGPESDPSPADLAAMLDDAVKKFQGFRDVDEHDPLLRARVADEALHRLGGAMAAFPGRKSLIWITHGIPLAARALDGQWADFTPMVNRLTAGFARTGTVVYPVQQSADGAASTADLFRTALEMFGRLTGGRWFPSDNSSQALASALREARGNYTIAYFAAEGKSGQIHKIRVSSSRKGVHLQTRDEYYPDETESEGATDFVEQSELEAVRRAPADAGEIGLRVAVQRSPATGFLHLTIRADPSDILIEPHDPGYHAALSMMLASYREGFPDRTSSPARVDFKLTAEQIEQARKDWLNFPADLAVTGQTQKVRVIVFDRGSRALGSVTIPLSE